ncbi:hypothetical protein GCM10027344_16250 [Spelaeicoccus albus]
MLMVRYDDAVYRWVAVNSIPRPGQALGKARFAGCDGSPLRTSSYHGKLFAVPGTDTGETVLLRISGHDSVYVKRSLKRAKWPALVKAAHRPFACEQAVTFTGDWKYADDDGTPDEKGHELTPPYTGTFTTTHGTGLGLDTWSRVTLDARITSHTHPVPTPRFLKRALAEKNPRHVSVTATCRGRKFDVTTIKFAN